MREIKAYKSYDRKFDLMIHDTEMSCSEGDFAMRLVERWGLVVAESDGEDSAGRSKHRKALPQEVVADACETAELMFAAMRERGWIIKIGTIADLEKQVAKEKETA